MTIDYSFTAADLEADLALLEILRWGRKEFVERLCRESRSDDEATLDVLRLEPGYHFAEFFYLLRARAIASAEDLEVLAELHNRYIVELTKDAGKMARLGLKLERLLDAIFTADTMPRLLQTWREHPGAIDQSNLARLLVAVMSTETCRKLVVACSEAGFLERSRTPFGTVVVSSTGALERIFGACLRDMRLRIEKGD
ncbi:MAG: hypothetical protein C5B56_06710 [Proteobacteria bacterium]|nr:MAG: hypothetical protein C5B56_06710 [Pseudomonadota bacterium]